MAYDRLDDEDMPGYFLPEDSQFRLAKLRDHVRFLVRLAQPRSLDEERAAEPKVRMGELALCLELLADQVDLVLDALSYPAQRTDTTRGAWPDTTTQTVPGAGSGMFRMTQQQIDRLTQLADTVSANARMVAAGDAAERAGQALPEVGSTLCAAANDVRELLLQIAHQPLRKPASNRVREERAVYALKSEAPPAGGGRLH
ncbi:XAC0095 family protein [uncultured Xanthomonas sp.]|uniref:XAC0095 family protein n=1 Tax=uncultured Xanthomonas sp. TaxID=152831 RepID=UPI0037484ABF